MGGRQNPTLHRMGRDWGEGASVASGGQGSGGASAAGDATWIHSSFPGRNWTRPGGDFVARASATTSTTQSRRDAMFASSTQLIADLQSFLGNSAVPAIGPLALPIPNDRALVGKGLIVQGFAAETSVFVTTSNGLEIRFGR